MGLTAVGSTATANNFWSLDESAPTEAEPSELSSETEATSTETSLAAAESVEAGPLPQLVQTQFVAAAVPEAGAALDVFELERRARHIFERFEDDGFLGFSPETRLTEIAGDLEGLSAADARALIAIYNAKYSGQRGGRDLPADLARELPTVAERFEATRALAPDRVQHQWSLGPPVRGLQTWSITAERPLEVQVPGAHVAYRLASVPMIYASDNPPQVRAFVLVPNADGSTRTIELSNREGRFEFQVPEVDHYQVVFEVKTKNGAAQYFTYDQIVRPPAQAAADALQTIGVTSPSPQLYSQLLDQQIAQVRQALAVEQAKPLKNQERIDQLTTALNDLTKAREEVPRAIGGTPGSTTGNTAGGAAPAIPIQAVLIAAETGQPIPLQLYAKPLGGQRWAIVDLTDPTRAKTYEASGATAEQAIENAWKVFIDRNQLPAGQIAAHAPQIPLGYSAPGVPAELHFSQTTWNQASDGETPLAKWVSGLSWGSLGLAALGVGALFVPGAQAAAPFLFAAAGVSGAAAGGLNIYDRTQSGTFELWSAQTAIDVLSIVGGAAAGAGSLARTAAVSRVLAGGSEVATASLATGELVQLQRVGNFISITSKVAGASGVGAGVLIGAEYLRAIQDVANSDLPPSEKERKTREILEQAALAGGLMIVGHGLGRLASNTALEARVLGSTLEPELKAELVRNPALAQRYDSVGGARLTELFNEYRRQPVPTESFASFALKRTNVANIVSEANAELSPAGSAVHPHVPPRYPVGNVAPPEQGAKTYGVLRVGNLEVPLISGEQGPGIWLRENLPTGPGSGNTRAWTHVEGHAAAIMRKYDVQNAELFINYEPCSTGPAKCANVLYKLLPPGARLTVNFLDANGTGVHTWQFEGGRPGYVVIR